jgi:hypothetical protein
MATQARDFIVGSLVRVRNREWVVLPSDENVVNLRPLSGSEGEVCAVHRVLEGHLVESAEFPFPQAAPQGTSLQESCCEMLPGLACVRALVPSAVWAASRCVRARTNLCP